VHARLSAPDIHREFPCASAAPPSMAVQAVEATETALSRP